MTTDARPLTAEEEGALRRPVAEWPLHLKGWPTTTLRLLATLDEARALPSTPTDREALLDAGRLANAYNNVIVRTGTGKGWTMETWSEVAAEYARLGESR